MHNDEEKTEEKSPKWKVRIRRKEERKKANKKFACTIYIFSKFTFATKLLLIH